MSGRCSLKRVVHPVPSHAIHDDFAAALAALGAFQQASTLLAGSSLLGTVIAIIGVVVKLLERGVIPAVALITSGTLGGVGEWWHYDFRGWERFELMDVPLDALP